MWLTIHLHVPKVKKGWSCTTSPPYAVPVRSA